MLDGKERRKCLFWFCLVNGILCVTAVFLLYSAENGGLGIFGRCPTVMLFHVYCPFCGGTRAALALLHGDILLSLRYNPTTILLCVLAAYYEVCVIAAILTGKRRWLRRADLRLLIPVAVISVLFCVFRNIMAVTGTSDFLGELAKYYRNIAS